MSNFAGNRNKWKKMIERKIRYDAKVVEYKCHLLNSQNRRIVLFHLIEEPFTIKVDDFQLTIPVGSYTTAYYWLDRPYNMYFWRDHSGHYLASYFNIVKNTKFEEGMVVFEDLIIDVLALPNGEHFILDEEELPEPFETFENGFAKGALETLLSSIGDVLSQTIAESQSIYSHKKFIPILEKGYKELSAKCSIV